MAIFPEYILEEVRQVPIPLAVAFLIFTFVGVALLVRKSGKLRLQFAPLNICRAILLYLSLLPYLENR